MSNNRSYVIRYFPLLAHRCDDLTPLDTLMSLLNSDKVYFNVKNTILEVIERLLNLETENEVNVSDLMYLDSSFRNLSEGILVNDFIYRYNFRKRIIF